MFGTATCRECPRSAAFKRKTPNLGELVEEERAIRASTQWPTVTVHGNGNRSEYGGKSGDGLDTAVKRAGEVSATWPTPQATDAKHTMRENMDGRQIMLIHAIRDRAAISAPWPTPCASDHKGNGKNGSDRDRLDYAVERGKTKRHIYQTVGTHPDTANCRMLNPDWVEWLMGWPIGWTDVDFRNADGGQCAMPWLDISDDPAEWPSPLMQRITTRKTHRVNRIETLGNGQVPLCAAVAFIYGREILRVALRLTDPTSKTTGRRKHVKLDQS